MITGKNTAIATSAIFEASPKPNASSSSGISAIFGIGNSAAISGSKKMRTGRNIAISRPTAMPGMTADEEAHEHAIERDADVLAQSSPLTTICQ